MKQKPHQIIDKVAASNLLGTLARHFCGMIYTCKPNATAQITECNESCLALTGYAAEQLCSDSLGLSQLIHPQDWPKLQTHWQHELTLTPTAPASIDLRLLRADDTEIWVRNQSSGIFSPDGQLISVEGVMFDITSIMQDYGAHDAKPNQLQDLYDQSPDMLLSINPHSGIIEHCNHTLCNTLGYYYSEIIGKSVFDLYTQDSGLRVQQELLPHFFSTGQLNSIELQVQRKDGTVIDVLLSSTAIHDTNGKIILTRSSWRNISDIKILERLQHRNASRFELVMSAIPVPYAFNTPDLAISYLNPAFTDTFGYTLQDIPNLEAWWTKAYPDTEYRQSVIEQWAQRLQNAIAANTEFEPMNIRVRCKSGEFKPVLAFAKPLNHNWNGDHLVALIDLSSQEQQQQQLQLREQRYKALFDTANISIWQEDMTGVVSKLDELRASGVRDLGRYLKDHPDTLFELVQQYKVTDINPATERLFRASRDELLADFSSVFGPGALEVVKDELLHFWERKSQFSSEVNLQTLDKLALRTIISFPIPQTIEAAHNVPVCIQDLSVTQELKSQIALQSEILENIQQGVYINRASDGIIIYTNPLLEQMFGYESEQMVGQHASIFNASDEHDPPCIPAQIIDSLNAQGHWEGEIRNQRLDGSLFWSRASVSCYEHPELGAIWISVLRDISSEVQARMLLDQSHAQLQAVANIQGKFIENQNERTAFDTVLQQICKICECDFGFIAEVWHKADATPYLRANAISNVSWSSKTKKQFARLIDQGDVFQHLNNVFNKPLGSSEILICNNPTLNAASDNVLDSEPLCMQNYMILPIVQGKDIIAEIGMANRPAGFNTALVQLLQPIILTYSQLIMALRNKRESRKATEALHQRDLLWKKAIEGAGHGVWDWNIQLNTMALSNSWAELLGYNPAEFSNNPQEWFNHVHPDDLKNLKETLKRHLNQETDSFSAEHRLRARDDTYKWILARGTVIERTEDGNALRMIGTSTDISKRKADEDELLSSRAQLAGMIDTAMDAIVTVDIDFNIILFNRSAEKMFGYPTYKVLGCPIELLIPARFTARHRGYMHDFASQGDQTRKMQVSNDREVKGRRADGSEFPAEVAISYSDNYGSPIYTAMIRDITERKLHEQSLIELTASLEERVHERTAELEAARVLAESANKAKSAFVANMSHEIRTPLNSVLGMAHLALKTDLNDKQRDYISKISRSGAHLLELINDILDFSKIEAGKLELDIADFSLINTCQEIKDLLEPKATEKRLGFELILDPALQTNVQGDALRLKQVLVNLIGNAIKFTEHGTIKLELTQLAQTDQNNEIRFCVSDSGIGISPEAQSRLFQSFQQADSSTTRKYGGTGLGLAISRQLIELMGGQLSLASKVNEGSQFSFVLSLQTAKTDLNFPLAHHDMNFLAILAGKRILLADDHPFNQQVGEDMLSEVGVKVCLANDGREAIALAEAEHFDAILMDIQMPNMDGFTATKILRAQAKFQNIPIIAMTANASKEDRDQSLAAGMNDFLSKPVQPEKLYRALVYWLVGSDIQGTQGNTCSDTSFQYIDLQVLETMVGAQVERQQKYLKRFIVAMREGLALIEKHQKTGALQEIGPECHRLKSIARTVGALPLGESLADLEGKKSAIPADMVTEKVTVLFDLFNLTHQELIQHRLIEAEAEPASEASKPLDTSMRIMLVDDDEFSLEILSQHLRDLGFKNIECCLDGQMALAQLRHAPLPDWIFCDLQMPNMDGIAFLRLLGQINYRGQVAILSGMDSTILKATEKLGQSFALNIHNALRKPIKKTDLAQLLNETRLDHVEAPTASYTSHHEALDLTELQRGLEHGAIELHYQPKVSIKDHRVIGAECLARWRHPTRGLLGPGLFVPAIETLGLVDDLTFNVLHLAAKQLKNWQENNLNIKLSVNVSMDNLHRLELPELFSQIIDHYGIAADSITLEVTETQLSHDYVLSLDILTRLRIKGFGLSIDDFGTGFSTMEHLLQTPFTELKIDRAFVQGASENPSAKTILEHSVMLGKKFNLNLVAEGVETQADWQLIAEVGCDEAQGYLVARPMPPEEFITWKLQWEDTTKHNATGT